MDQINRGHRDQGTQSVQVAEMVNQGHAIILQNEDLRLVVLPDCGGKIASLKDRRTDMEWLWRNSQLEYKIPDYGESYVEKLDSGGWDEVFPSVSPTENIPDHGDLVQLPWAVQCHEEERLRMSVEGRCAPFYFERDLFLSGSRIHCEYRIENRGEKAFPWLWCAHPLFPLTPEVAIEAEGEFRVDSGLGAASQHEGKLVSLDDLPFEEKGWAAKLFGRREALDTVTLRHQDGSGLRLSWDAEMIPYLGLWVNNGGWSGCGSEPYFNLGVEPTSLPIDNLSEAEYPSFLSAGESVSWSLTVSLI